jgi:hypothetical protein
VAKTKKTDAGGTVRRTPGEARTKQAVADRDRLATRIAEALGISREEAELRALCELAERVAPEQPPKADRIHTPPARESPSAGALPERLYLLLDGRGLDGRGMPVEVIDDPTTIGSARTCTVWVNSPQIETRHLQITRDGDAWLLDDLGTEKGTFLRGERVQRRRIENGDEYRLAGYLRLRTELR